MTDLDRFPLGVPINRAPPRDITDLHPIPGRRNWYTDHAGAEVYRESTGQLGKRSTPDAGGGTK